jgi:hypothetical protein
VLRIYGPEGKGSDRRMELHNLLCSPNISISVSIDFVPEIHI